MRLPVFLASLLPAAAFAAASVQPLTPVNTSVLGGERVVYSVRFFDSLGHPAAGETVFDSVPVTDIGFTQLPAQKDDVGAQHAREVDETLLDSFTNATVGVDLLHPVFDLFHQPSDFAILLQSFHEIGRFRIDHAGGLHCGQPVARTRGVSAFPAGDCN